MVVRDVSDSSVFPEIFRPSRFWIFQVFFDVTAPFSTSSSTSPGSVDMKIAFAEEQRVEIRRTRM